MALIRSYFPIPCHSHQSLDNGCVIHGILPVGFQTARGSRKSVSGLSDHAFLNGTLHPSKPDGGQAEREDDTRSRRLVAFPVVGQLGYEDTSLVIYTTTPWTLPSNLFIAVNPSFEYVRMLDERSGRHYILLDSGLSFFYKDPKKAKYKVVNKVSGKEMIGWKYTPLFPYFTEQISDCFQVIGAGYVGEYTDVVKTPCQVLPPCASSCQLLALWNQC